MLKRSLFKKMSMCRVAYGLSTHSVKLHLSDIQIYQNVVYIRKFSSDTCDSVKGWFFHPRIEDISSKSIISSFKSVMAETELYERHLYNELLEELNLHKVLQNEMRYFFSKDIRLFGYFGIKLEQGELTRNVLKYLEPFPFDMTPIYYYSKSKRDRISIKTILMIIEAQYLAHRLNVELQIINTYFKEMKSCFFHYKSMRSVQRNMDALLADKNLKQMNMSNIIFFLNNLRPFNVKQLRHVEKDLVGISWKETPLVCPSLVRHSYLGIMFRIKMLREMGFTDEQIRLGLPYLGILVRSLYGNVKYMLSKFGSHRDDEFFLRLLGVCFFHQRGLKGMVWDSYEAIQKAILVKEEKRQSLLKSKQIICFLQDKLGMTKKEWKILRKHPAVIVENRAVETLNFLEHEGYTKDEILESITIILYPKYLIKNSLKRITKKGEKFRECGLENGCVRKETTFFARGTKLRRKTLQLCLYYIEKSVYVTKDTVLDLNRVSEEMTKRPMEV